MKEEIKKAMNIKDMEKKSATRDPLIAYCFGEYFEKPVTAPLMKRFERAIQKISNLLQPQGNLVYIECKGKVRNG